MSMTVTDNGGSTTTSGTTTINVTPASTFTSQASLAILVLVYSNAGTSGADPYSSITDAFGNTWTSRVATVNTGGNTANAGSVTRIFTCPQTLGKITTSSNVTITFSTSTACAAWQFWEVTGTLLQPTFKQTGTGTTGNTATPSVTSASITSGNPIIGALGGCYSPNFVSATADADSTNGSWSSGTNRTANGTGPVVNWSQYKVTTGTGTQTFNPTWSGVSRWSTNWIEVEENSGNVTITIASEVKMLVRGYWPEVFSDPIANTRPQLDRKPYDGVMDTTTSTGIGPITLAGQVNGYQPLSIVGNGNRCDVKIYAVDGSGKPTGDEEVCQGTYSSSGGGTFTREYVYSSSNSDLPVTFAAGTKRIILVGPAELYFVKPSIGQVLAQRGAFN